MELGIDVLHITKTHDSRKNFSTLYDTWSCHSSEEGNKSQGAATFTRMATEGGIQQHKCVAGEGAMGKRGGVANHSLLPQQSTRHFEFHQSGGHYALTKAWSQGHPGGRL